MDRGNLEIPQEYVESDQPTPNRSLSAVRVAKFNKILDAEMVSF